jgi:glycerol-3-phosphate acyltransferase PlsX
MKQIVVDIFGGDYAPVEIMEGCLLALNEIPDVAIVMVGKEDVISAFLATKQYDKNRIIIVDAPDVITNDDVPTVAIRLKKDSSLVKALEYTRDCDSAIGMASAGSTGAVLTGATLKIGRIAGVSRPALAPVLPTIVENQKVLLCDCGANVDCKPQMLVQFAQMGVAFMQSVYGVANPRVGLLSNGTEDKKGNAFSQEVFHLLHDTSLNFVGNMEAREILSGDYDVVVADGFYGNIALKACEGTATTMLKLIKKEVTATFSRKIGALLLKPAFKKVQSIMDYNKSGGAPFLGIKKVVIKSHGASKAPAICGSIKQVADFDRSRLIENLTPYFATGGADD